MNKLLVLLVLQIHTAACFCPLATTTRHRGPLTWDVSKSAQFSTTTKTTTRTTTQPAASSSSEDSSSGSNSDSLLESLRQRQLELQSDEKERANKWKTADCSSSIRLILPNWVRRLDVEYPLVACGSGRGDVYLGNLETGNVVAIGQVEEKEDDDNDNEEESERTKKLQKVVRVLFNGYDGGGTLAMAFQGTLICEARRSGGVHVWRLDPESDRLVPQGSIPALKDDLVTALHLDKDYLWVGSVDGVLQAYSLREELPLALQNTPEMEWEFEETILSMAFSLPHGCGAVTTSAGSVSLFSVEGEDVALGSFYPPFDSTERKSVQSFPSSVTFVEMHDARDGSHINKSLLVACGGNDGSIYLQPVELTSSGGEVDADRPFSKPLRPLRPRHFGPAKCLASPVPGILVSAGYDGGMRVWDVHEAICLYQFVGYKVWMGSLWTDGDRIVSDGADNTVIVHDFTKGNEP